MTPLKIDPTRKQHLFIRYGLGTLPDWHVFKPQMRLRAVGYHCTISREVSHPVAPHWRWRLTALYSFTDSNLVTGCTKSQALVPVSVVEDKSLPSGFQAVHRYIEDAWSLLEQELMLRHEVWPLVER